MHGFILGFLFCSIDLYFCLCASTILSWWLWLCHRAWSQAGWFLQFHSSFSRFLWLFKVFCISIQIVKLFVLVLWKIPLASALFKAVGKLFFLKKKKGYVNSVIKFSNISIASSMFPVVSLLGSQELFKIQTIDHGRIWGRGGWEVHQSVVKGKKNF